MNKNKNPNEHEPPPPHYKFYLGSRERYIHISSDFESGNIRLVRQLSEFNVRHTLPSTDSAALMTASKLTTGSTPKAGSTSECTASPKTPKANLQSAEFRPSWQSTYLRLHLDPGSQKLPSRLSRARAQPITVVSLGPHRH